MATIRQIAEAAGVSRTTVSRVLNDTPGCTHSEQTRRRVLEIAKRLHYQPSPVARALARRRTNVLAIAGGRPNNPHYGSFLPTAHAMASASGLTVTFLLDQVTPTLRQVLRRGQADIGLVARGQLAVCDELLDSLVAPHQMVVGAGPVEIDYLPSRTRVAYWSTREAYGQALEHLHQLGHRQVVYLSGATAGDRLQLAYEEAERIGLQLRHVAVRSVAVNLEQGAEMAREAMKMRPRPTALFARNDEFALGAIHALFEAGLRVPQEISVMGYFDIPFAAFATPPLTSIRTPFVECVEEVLGAALEALKEGTREALEPKVVRFPTKLVQRRSTTPPA